MLSQLKNESYVLLIVKITNINNANHAVYYCLTHNPNNKYKFPKNLQNFQILIESLGGNKFDINY